MKLKYIYLLIFSIFSLLVINSCSEDDLVDGTRTGAISGKVIASDTNASLENVKISTNPASNTAFTDNEGNFVINNVLIGQYAVQAELNGYTTTFESINVVEGSTANVAFEMSLANTSNTPPSKTQLSSPANSSEDIPLETQLVWFKSKDANSSDKITYTVNLRDTKNNELTTYTVETDTTLTVSNLNINTSYLWYINTSDGTNESVSSDIWEFTTLNTIKNPYLFVRNIDGNNVIFSGPVETTTTDSDGNTTEVAYQLTSNSKNSYKPRGNFNAKKIAFMRSTGGNTQLFTMDYDGTSQKQVTSSIPIAGFRSDYLDFCWALNGSKIYYPHFDKLYSIDPNGGGTTEIYRTPDGAFISEVEVPQFNDDLVLIKTNNNEGYNAKIQTIKLSTSQIQNTIIQGQQGAINSVDISANGDKIIYSRDITNSQNTDYRIFESRLFLYNLTTGVTSAVNTGSSTGENDLHCKFSPSEGQLIFTRVENYQSATPSVYRVSLNNNTTNTNSNLVYNNASMPDWRE